MQNESAAPNSAVRLPTGGMHGGMKPMAMHPVGVGVRRELPVAGKAAVSAETTALRGGTAGVAEVKQPQPQAGEGDAAIRTLSRVQSLGYSVWTIGWVKVHGFPLPVFPVMAWGLGWLASGIRRTGWTSGAKVLESGRTAVRMAIDPLSKGLAEVSLREIHTLPGVMMRHAAKVASGEAALNSGMARSAQVGESYWKGAAAPIAARAENVDRVMAGVATRTSQTVAPMRQALGRGVDAFAESGVGKGISGGLSRLMQWRHTRVSAKLAPTLEAAQTAFSAQPRSLWQWLTRQKPVAVVPHAAFSEAMQLVNNAASHTGQMRADTLAQAKEAMQRAIAAHEGNNALGKHGTAIVGKIEKAMGTAAKAVHLEQVNAGGVATWLKNAAARVGNAKLMSVAVAVGVVAGAGVAFLSAHRDNKRAEKELQDFVADIGDPQSEMAKKAASKTAHQGVGRYVSAALTTAGEALMLSGSNAEHLMTVMPAQMALMSAGGMFTGENEAVKAHAALKQAERGETQLNRDEKVELAKHLVSAVPEVAANGGVYNPLTTSTSEAIVARNDTVKETMHLLNDKQAFMQLATKSDAQRKAALQEIKAANDAETVPAANDAHYAAAKPATGVHASSIQRDGMLAATPQKLRA